MYATSWLSCGDAVAGAGMNCMMASPSRSGGR